MLHGQDGGNQASSSQTLTLLSPVGCKFVLAAKPLNLPYTGDQGGVTQEAKHLFLGGFFFSGCGDDGWLVATSEHPGGV